MNYYNKDTVVFFNGKFLKATEVNNSFFSQTLHYGHGVFEGMRAYQTPEGTHIFKAEEHLARLAYSAQQLHLSLPYSLYELTEICYELLDANNLGDAYIRPLLTAGEMMGLQPSTDTNLFIAAWHWGKFMGDKPVRVAISSYSHPNPGGNFKRTKVCGHYVYAILATQEAKSRGFDEALLLDKDGNIAEGAGANFFFEANGKLYTPSVDNILPGITRSAVLELAKEIGIDVIEGNFKPQEIFAADGAFFTGTACEITGIQAIENHVFAVPFEETIGHQLAGAYKSIVLGKRNSELVV
jgi:branched-chain amino acid aminotransferase